MPALSRRPPPRPANPGLARGWYSASVKCQCVPAAWLLNLNPGAWRNQSSQADLARVAEQGPKANGWTDGHICTHGRPETRESPPSSAAPTPAQGNVGPRVRRSGRAAHGTLSRPPGWGLRAGGHPQRPLHFPASCPGEAWKVPLRTLVLQAGHGVHGGERAALTPTGRSGRPTLW